MAKIPKEYAERVFRVTPARLFTESETEILERYGRKAEDQNGGYLLARQKYEE